jgi:hypothetical protein
MNFLLYFCLFSFTIIVSASDLKRNLGRTASFEEEEEENYLSDKVLKKPRLPSPDELISRLRELSESGLTEKFNTFVRIENCCDLLLKKNSDILEILITEGREGILKKIFSGIFAGVWSGACASRFDLFMEAIRFSAVHNRKILYALLRSAYFPFSDTPHVLVEYFVKTDDFDAICEMLNIGFCMKYIRTGNNDTLAHLAVRKENYSLIEALRKQHGFLFSKANFSNEIPLHLAKDKRMIKLLRQIHPKGRDYSSTVDGVSLWQSCLLSGDFERLKTLISFSRRVKKLKNSFIDYHRIPWLSSAKVIKINRETLLKDSFQQVTKLFTNDDWFRPNNKFFIKFVGEVGIDAGGLKVEWVHELLKAFFSNETTTTGSVKDFTAPLFIKVDDETGMFAPNVKYPVKVFKFAGSIVALSLALGVPMKAKFIPVIPKFIFNQEIDLDADLQSQSPSMYRNLQALYDPGHRMADLDIRSPTKPNITVNRRNIPKFIKEYSQSVLYLKYAKQIDAFVQGFKSVLPQPIQNFITLNELVSILLGKPEDYTAEEFVSSCDCSDALVSNDLKRVIEHFNETQRSLLLKFITGIDRLPVTGFSGLSCKPKIAVLQSLAGKLPTSSTCSNFLKLPPYANIEELERKLLMAIELAGNLDYEHGLQDDEGIVLGLDDDVIYYRQQVDSDSDASTELNE